MNIVSNALAFSPPGERVRIQAGASTAGSTAVIDRGRGIPRAERERMFLPFQRLGDHPNGAGSVSGSRVAKGFVEAMGGECRSTTRPAAADGVISLPEAAE